MYYINRATYIRYFCKALKQNIKYAIANNCVSPIFRFLKKYGVREIK